MKNSDNVKKTKRCFSDPQQRLYVELPTKSAAQVCRHKLLHFFQILRQHGITLFALEQISHVMRQCRVCGLSRLTYSFREFCRMSSSQTDHRDILPPAGLPGSFYTNGSVRIQQILALIKDLIDDFDSSVVTDAIAAEQLAGTPSRCLTQGHGAGFEVLHQLTDRIAVAVVQVKQHPLKVTRDHDIHARR